MSHSPPPVSLRPAAPSYLMGTPDCLMCVTAAQRTPHPVVLICSNRGPTAALSRQSASCRLQGKRSIQVTPRLRHAGNSRLFVPSQTTNMWASLCSLSCSARVSDLHPSHRAGRCRPEAKNQLQFRGFYTQSQEWQGPHLQTGRYLLRKVC